MTLFSPLFLSINDALDAALASAKHVRRIDSALPTPHAQVSRVVLDRPAMGPTPEFRAWMHRLAAVAGELESEARATTGHGAERRTVTVGHLDRALLSAEKVVAKKNS